MTDTIHELVHDKYGIVHLEEETRLLIHLDVDELLISLLLVH